MWALGERIGAALGRATRLSAAWLEASEMSQSQIWRQFSFLSCRFNPHPSVIALHKGSGDLNAAARTRDFSAVSGSLERYVTRIHVGRSFFEQ